VGGTSAVPNWALDGELQYSTETQRTQRAVVTARYAPGEFRTISTTYRLTRGASEQMEIGWQWPLRLSSPGPAAAARAGDARASSGGSCTGNWYTVGRINYSMQEKRITDSVVGFEYDAGCWIGRVVAERLSTGRSQATTRLLLQLELVGLSRLGANPLKVLKDNIPGYRLLREDVRGSTEAPTYD
jgi:LPS-assembly protein